MQLKGEGGSLVDFEGLLRGLSWRTPAGSRSRASRCQGGLPPTTVIRCTRGESAASVYEFVCVHTCRMRYYVRD